MSNTIKVVPAVIVLHKGEKRKRTAETNILVRVGPNLVASGTIGGHYDNQQAFQEFRKGNPKLRVREGMNDLANLVRTMTLPA